MIEGEKMQKGWAACDGDGLEEALSVCMDATTQFFSEGATIHTGRASRREETSGSDASIGDWVTKGCQ